MPPLDDSTRRVVPRDLIVLLDASDSMRGRPLDQAKALCRALIDGPRGARPDPLAQRLNCHTTVVVRGRAPE